MTIVHTTDLSGDDLAAFQHACALAAASGARLVTLHGNAPPAAALQLPDAAPVAARWGRAISHERVCHQCCDEVADTVVHAIRGIAPALVVAGTHGRHGLAALLSGSIAEAIARNVSMPVLIVPNRVRGFVDPATGAIDLRRVLVPAEDAAAAARGEDAAKALAALARVPGPQLEVLHVGDARVAASIVDRARAHHSCLIAMTTRGHDGIVDALLGSRTEHVVRDAGCPVLIVP